MVGMKDYSFIHKKFLSLIQVLLKLKGYYSLHCKLMGYIVIHENCQFPYSFELRGYRYSLDDNWKRKYRSRDSKHEEDTTNLENEGVYGRDVLEVKYHGLWVDCGFHQVAVCDDGGGECRGLLVLVGVRVALLGGREVPVE